MPTNKIENREDAAQSFMEGAYFKVGDRFISPDEIVTARLNDNGEPVFKLTTGEVVIHDRFDRGSVGHFLFEQLRKVEGRYEEVRKPTGFNILFQDASVFRAIALTGNVVRDIDSDIDVRKRFPQINEDTRTIAGQLTSNDNFAAHKFNGDKIGEFKLGNSIGASFQAYDAAPSGTSYAVTGSNNGGEVVAINPDGTTESVVKDTANFFANVYSPPNVSGLAVSEDTAPNYALLGLETQQFSQSIARLDLSKNDPDVQEFSNTFDDVWNKAPIYYFNGSVYYITFNSKSKIRKLEDVTNLNSPTSTVIDLDQFGGFTYDTYYRITPEKIVIKDVNNGIHLYDRKTGKIKKDYTGFANLHDGYTDLSIL